MKFSQVFVCVLIMGAVCFYATSSIKNRQFREQTGMEASRGYFFDRTFHGPITPKTLWHKDSADTSIQLISVTENVIIYTSANNLLAIDAKNGEEIWKNHFPKNVGTSFTSDEKTVFVTIGKDRLAAIDRRTGRNCWEVPIPSIPKCCKALKQHLIIGTTNSVLAVNKETGGHLWKTNINGSLLQLTKPIDDVVLVASLVNNEFTKWSSEVSAIDSTSGAILWEIPLKGKVIAPITIVNGKCYLVASSGTLHDLGPTGFIRSMDYYLGGTMIEVSPKLASFEKALERKRSKSFTKNGGLAPECWFHIVDTKARSLVRSIDILPGESLTKCEPFIFDRTLYVRDYYNNIYSLNLSDDLANLKVIGRQHDFRLYSDFCDFGYGIKRIDRLSQGSQLISLPLLPHELQLQENNGLLFTGRATSDLLSVSMADRQIKWRVDLSACSSTIPMVLGGFLVVGCADNTLQFFELSSGKMIKAFNVDSTILQISLIGDSTFVTRHRSGKLIAWSAF